MSRNWDDFNCETCNCNDQFERPGQTYCIDGVIETKTCLRQLVTEQSAYFLRLHQHYKNGVLPLSGGLLDQPHKYVRAMEIFDQCLLTPKPSSK